jgi:inhibitor of nuclear factor kappa-B kinase subunit alpha
MSKRLQRSKALLERFADENMDTVVFSDEKFFSIEERFNSQNVRIYSASIVDILEHLRTVQRFQAEKKIMVWCGISKKEKFPMVFIEPGAKINATYYKTHILEKVVRPHGHRIYNGSNWTFQQDSAPAHKAIICQNWCHQNLPDFISTKEWPPSSPDLNPLDYSTLYGAY